MAHRSTGHTHHNHPSSLPALPPSLLRAGDQGTVHQRRWGALRPGGFSHKASNKDSQVIHRQTPQRSRGVPASLWSMDHPPDPPAVKFLVLQYVQTSQQQRVNTRPHSTRSPHTLSSHASHLSRFWNDFSFLQMEKLRLRS